MHRFDYVFHPRSIAVVGASHKVGSVGAAVMRNLLEGGYTGRIYPVNIKPTHFPGLPTFPTLGAVDESVDLVLVMVPARAVPEVLNQAAKIGAKAAVVISAGFKEAGPEGAELEKQIARICADAGIVLVGPNCLGVLNPRANLNASFAGAAAVSGSLTIISQSGALGTGILDVATTLGLGFSKFITIGNKALWDDLELLQYLAEDPETKAIAWYAESLTPSNAWVAAARRITSIGPNRKPIIILKAGQTVAGAEAARSHTGSLAGDGTIYDAFFRQAGLIQVNSIEALLQSADCLVNNLIPKVSGSIILTNAGGPGILAADEASRVGLPLSGLSPQTKAALATTLPLAASLHNPVDILGDADAARYQFTLEQIIKDGNVGGVLCIITPQSMTDASEIAQQIVQIRHLHPSVGLVVCLFGGTLLDTARKVLRDASVCVVDYPEVGIQALHALDQQRQNSANKPHRYEALKVNIARADAAIVEAMHQNRSFLNAKEATQVLDAYAIPHASGGLAKNAVEAAQIAHGVGRAVVLKVSSPDILHKTEVGGVMQGVMPSHTSTSFTQLLKTVREHKPQARIEGVLVQEMVPVGQEVIVGAKRDPVFGPVLLVGLGGIYVEVWHDSVVRILPIDSGEAQEMIQSLAIAPLLFGTRNQEPLDTEALVHIMIRVAELMLNHPEISELDLNPVMVQKAGSGALAVDARIILR